MEFCKPKNNEVSHKGFMCGPLWLNSSSVAYEMHVLGQLILSFTIGKMDLMGYPAWQRVHKY
jgi:hypothetical protein